MVLIAITGGVATGKSSVLAKLKQIWRKGGAFFSADAVVHELLTTPVIKTKVVEVFGNGVVGASGDIDRDILRRIVFRDDDLRKRLEGILHPEVQALADQVRVSSEEDQKDYLVFEIPLLYEVDSSLDRQFDVVVGSSEPIQRQRLVERRGIEPEIVEKIFQAQMPIEHKVARADFVIWNDGAESELNEQVRLLANALEHLVA